jgi:hypothetical protein
MLTNQAIKSRDAAIPAGYLNLSASQADGAAAAGLAAKSATSTVEPCNFIAAIIKQGQLLPSNLPSSEFLHLSCAFPRRSSEITSSLRL